MGYAPEVVGSCYLELEHIFPIKTCSEEQLGWEAHRILLNPHIVGEGDCEPEISQGIK